MTIILEKGGGRKEKEKTSFALLPAPFSGL
jgi:hypothetical protein